MKVFTVEEDLEFVRVWGILRLGERDKVAWVTRDIDDYTPFTGVSWDDHLSTGVEEAAIAAISIKRSITCRNIKKKFIARVRCCHVVTEV